MKTQRAIRSAIQTLSTSVGTITFRVSFHKSGLNVKLPSISNNKSLVSLAQSSPKCVLVGSSPMALNQSPTDENKLSSVFCTFRRRTDDRSRKFGCRGCCSWVQGHSLLEEGPSREYVNRCKTERVQVDNEPCKRMS